MSGNQGEWIVPISGLIISSSLVVFAFIWAFTARLPAGSLFRRTIEAVVKLPIPIWLMLGLAAFTLPVLEYWITAHSHGNALVGFLPWADATEYFHCSETFLLGAQSAEHCGKRPFYVAFFTDLLWLTGNRLQPALLLQATLVGTGAVLFIREVTRNLDGPAALSAYAVLYTFAAALCAGLVMTENASLFLGLFAIALLWRSADTPQTTSFLFGIALMAGALSARPGPMFVLPALLAWYYFYSEETSKKRLLTVALGVAVVILAMGYTALPISIAGGTIGSTHSNFSYTLYGLVTGGNRWQQVTIDHPEFFNQSIPGRAATDLVYEAAIESLITRPHLFILGYIKGIAHYLDDLFRFATAFKPLRLIGFLLPWIIGVWAALKQWRQPRYALLLSLQAGIIISSPFIAIDGQNRVFAATVAVDALFVALGIVWISNRLTSKTQLKTKTSTIQAPVISLVAYAGVLALLLPVAMLAAIYPNALFAGHTPPSCERGQEAIVVRPGRSTLVLPLVKAGEETLYPIQVRADRFEARFHKTVHSKEELRLPPGQTLVWGTRLDKGLAGKPIYFIWSGELPHVGQLVGFCIARPGPGKRIGTATSIHR